MNSFILEMNQIVKEFPGVRALKSVNMKVRRGEIHAIVGENGAGKSTLMKVLSGVYPYGTYEGEILIDGKQQRFQNIKESEAAGVGIIYQELTLVKEMSITENIFLGNEISRYGRINWDQATMRTKELLRVVGLRENPETKVAHLGIGKQQLVEIAKALSKRISLLILDEPTAALNETDSENLLNILRRLQKEGMSCIYISHKLREVKEIADTVTILRDGETVGTYPNDDRLTVDQMITGMVGRPLTQLYPRKEHHPGEVVLEVRDWTVDHPEIPDKKLVDHLSFTVKKGEILGFAGLMGAGRTELMMSLFGAFGSRHSGEIVIEGEKVSFNHPREAIRKGLSYLSEDRKKNGLVLMMDVKENITLAGLEKIRKGIGVDDNQEIQVAMGFVKALRIKTPSLEQKVMNLSGGNQQKVAIAKWLLADPKILILDEPTRGIDVGAKVEIYHIMNDLVDQGVSIIMVSSELPEILGMSDRILVIHEGKITAEMDWREASQEKVMKAATGVV